MVNSRECKRRFKMISKGKENSGYVEWRKWVYGQIEDYDLDKLQNLIKRNEIRLKQLNSDEGFSNFDMMTHCMSMLVGLIPFVGTVILTTLNAQLSIYHFDSDDVLLKDFARIVSECTQEVEGLLVQMALIIVLVACLGLILARGVSMVFQMVRSGDRIYLEELLTVLKNEEKENYVEEAIIQRNAANFHGNFNGGMRYAIAKNEKGRCGKRSAGDGKSQDRK